MTPRSRSPASTNSTTPGSWPKYSGGQIPGRLNNPAARRRTAIVAVEPVVLAIE